MTTSLMAYPPSSRPPQYEGSQVRGASHTAMPLPSFERNMFSELFYNAKHCLESVTELEQINNNIIICKSDAYGRLSSQECTNRQNKLESRLRITSAQPDLANCSKDPEVASIRFGEATVKAARAGNPDAQICYVEGQWGTSGDSESLFYKTMAERYMKMAFARGDWRVVQLLTITSESVAHGGAGRMVNLPIIGVPFTVYRANRLLEFGATGHFLEIVRTRARNAMKVLTPAKIENANTWALEEFKRHFANSPKLTSYPEACLQAIRTGVDFPKPAP